MARKLETLAKEELARFNQITIYGKQLETPIFFPSISSFGLEVGLLDCASAVQ